MGATTDRSREQLPKDDAARAEYAALVKQAATGDREAMERLLSYGWPGNVREMRNVLERALILARGQSMIGVEHLPGEFRARPGVGDRRHTPLSLDDLERQHIDRTLKHHGGNRTRAAAELGISRATLINKIKRYNLTG